MNMKSTIRNAVLVAIFIVAVAGVFILAQRKVTKDVTHCGLISIMAACVLIYFYNRYVYGAIEPYQPVKDTGPEVKEFQARTRRLEEKVRKLTAELSAAKLKLETEISNRPLDQRELQQRLKHLNCLYGLSKIVNRQEIPLEQIFHETVYLIRDAFRYPNAMCVRITFDGIRYETDNFKKSESSRQTRIKAQSEDVGAIEVYHLAGASQSGQEVFLKEEDDLLSAVAEWLGSIAERKKAEEKLRLFRNLIERSNDCIFAVEPKWGRFLDVNNRACDSLGYTQKELLNMMTIKDIEESLPDDESWRKQVEQLKQKKDIVKESRYKRKNGTTFFVETSLKLVSQEKQDYIIAIARDITERKRAETTLKTAQEKLLRPPARWVWPKSPPGCCTTWAMSLTASASRRSPFRKESGTQKSFISATSCPFSMSISTSWGRSSRRRNRARNYPPFSRICPRSWSMSRNAASRRWRH